VERVEILPIDFVCHYVDEEAHAPQRLVHIRPFLDNASISHLLRAFGDELRKEDLPRIGLRECVAVLLRLFLGDLAKSSLNVNGHGANATPGTDRLQVTLWSMRWLQDVLRRHWRDPLLDADYVEDFQPRPKRGQRYSPGRYLQLPGVEKDAVPWPTKEGASRTARTSVTATRWRG
jgi:hypothetical protein